MTFSDKSDHCEHPASNMKMTLTNEDNLKKERLTKMKSILKYHIWGSGLRSQTIFPTPDTSKSYKWQPSIANWNYSGSARVGSVGSNSDSEAISASQQSWSLGLAELGNSMYL